LISPLQILTRSKAIVVAALLCVGVAAYGIDATPPPSLNRGFQQMYNLDFTAAHATFGAYQQVHPEDPMGPVSNAAAYLFSEFDRLHILEADLFTDDHRFDNRAKLTPDPAVKAEFDKELAKSTDLANRKYRAKKGMPQSSQSIPLPKAA
jgi:hypothetical protein